MVGRCRTRAALVVGLAAVLGVASPALAAHQPVEVVASGLNGPFGLRFSGDGNTLHVAEGFAGQVTRVDEKTGQTTPVVTGLPSPAGVVRTGGELAIITGSGEVPEEGDASVLVAPSGGGEATVIADLEAYELANNPDGQQQFDSETGAPLDALSNPFSVLAHRKGFVLVADGGANAVLAVSRSGNVSTYFVPPNVTSGDCAGAPNNDPEHPGCDSVPTGLAYGPNQTLYVSTLSGDVPGEGRVYVLKASTGEVLRVIRGLNGPTGVAVAPDGTVYVSEVFHNAPQGPPPDGFDPASIGRIVRIGPNGKRTYASVPMPTGLEFHRGTLYASAWSVANFLGIDDAGQIVTVRSSAFSSP